MKQYQEALYLSYRPQTEWGYFTVFQDKLHSVNIQDDQSLAFSETVQKNFQNQPVLTFDKRSSVWMNINRVTLQHNNEFIMLIFFI